MEILIVLATIRQTSKEVIFEEEQTLCNDEFWVFLIILFFQSRALVDQSSLTQYVVYSLMDPNDLLYVQND